MAAELVEKAMVDAKPDWAGQVWPEVRGERWLFAGAGGKAEAEPGLMAVRPLPEGGYAIRASVEFTSAGDVLSLALGQDGTSAFRIQLHGDHIDVIRDGHADETRDQLGEQQVELPIGRPFALSVEVADEVLVRIDGKDSTQLGYGKRDMHTFWSIGHRGGMFWVQDLRVESIKKSRR